MKAAKTWCLAGLVFVAGVSSASCGKDEGTGGNPGTVIGGSGGNGGSSGGGNTGRAGGGSGSGTAATKLGQACVNDSQCVDPNAPGLTCVTATDTLGSGAPPKGLCTATCDTSADCQAYGAGSLCYGFGDSDTGYCIEGCNFGSPDLGETKCHDRAEFACDPALLEPTSSTCSDSNDCQSGELCIDGRCAVIYPGCLPACRGDIDCADGMYCDQSFLSGVCVDKKPTGKAFGEPCTPSSDADDECLGFCQADDETGVTGHCALTCGIGTQCGWNPETKKFDGACLYASLLTRDGGVGDFGFCAGTCNCSDECKDPSLECSLLDGGALPSTFRGPGVCFTADPSTTEYNQCKDTPGSGGAGGESSAGGAAGAGPDAGGAPGAGGAGGDAGGAG